LLQTRFVYHKGRLNEQMWCPAERNTKGPQVNIL